MIDPKRLLIGATASLIIITSVLVVAIHHRAEASSRAYPRPQPFAVEMPSTPTLLPNGWQITPAGHAITLPGDMPLKMLFSPDGKSLLVNTGGFHDHTINVIDLADNTLRQSVDVGNDWDGMALSPTGDMLYVSGGGTVSKAFLAGASELGASPALMASLGKPMIRLSFTANQLTLQTGLDIDGLDAKNRFVGGVAVSRDGDLYVVNTQNDTVYKLSGSPMTTQVSVKVGYRPLAASLSPDGKTLAVSNWGGKSVSLLDARTLAEQQQVPVGSHPNDLVWAKDGRLFVANAGDNSVSIIHDGKVIETVKTSLDPKAPVGSTPDALGLSPDGTRLYVANADNNDVAVINIADPQESQVLGFIPTGWYPSALAVSPDGKKLYIGTGKGLKFGPNAEATEQPQPGTEPKFKYIGGMLSGTVSVVDIPTPAQIAAYTRQVIANTPGLIKKTARIDPDIQKNVYNKIKHVVYIIRENRTYDQVFGDIKEGNGAPNLTLFGETVTPNAHALAENFVLLDNLYCNGEVSQDGHEWCDAAYATDFTEKAWPLSYNGRPQVDADDRLTDSPAGYLWDNCAKHGVTYYAYGERAEFHSEPNSPPVFGGARSLAGHANEDYGKINWFTGPRDAGRADIFIKDLHHAEQTGTWPQFMIMSLPEDHTQGLKAGGYTPDANVGENDQALGKIVAAVSHSKFWPETAIFVIEDDAQNGPDHVDAHRTVGLVISPFIKHHAVDSMQYTTASYVRTIEAILHLPPMSQFDAAARPLDNAFTPQPTLTAYTALPARVDLEAKNPSKGAGAVASAKLDFSAPDRADPDALNLILWNAIKPGIPMPAPVRSARLLKE